MSDWTRPGIARAALCLLLAAGWTAARPELGHELIEARSPENPRPLPGGATPPRFRPRLPGGNLPAGRDSVIRDDFPLNDDSSGVCRKSGPAVRVLPDDGCIVAWYDFRDGNADVVFQRIGPDGTPVGVNRRVNVDASMGWQGLPATGVGPDGSFLFTWEDRREIGNSDLFCQRYDPAGNEAGGNFRVSDSGATGDQVASGVHVGPGGGFLAAWDDRRFGITGDIFGQFFRADGTPRDTNFRVNDDPVGLANQYRPAVAGDDSGRFAVAWMDGRGLNPYDWNVFLQRFDSTGGRLGSNLQVTTNDSIQWDPAIAVRADGGFVVCWEDRRDDDADAFARSYDAGGVPHGAAFRVNDDAAGATQYQPDAAVNRYGEALVSWADTRGGAARVFARRLGPGGTPLGPSWLVDSQPGSHAEPSAAARSDGGYWVAWVNTDQRQRGVFCARLARDGSVVTPAFPVHDDRASTLQRIASIGTDGRGVSCVAWEDERDGTTDIYRSLFDRDGVVAGPNLRVNDDGPGGSAQYYAATGAGTGRYLVAWTDGRDGYHIYGQFLDAAGVPVGPNQRINSGGASALQWYPFVAMDRTNRSVVVWMDTRETDAYGVYARRYDSAGAAVGPDFRVSDGTGDQVYASVAMNDAGRFVAAWMDYREAEADIYCRPFRADGTPAADDIRVNTDSAGAFQGYPGCAVAADGGFVVSWDETRDGRNDVYVQWFDSLGNRVGGEERVNDDPADAAAYASTCAFDPAGRLAVVFNDERDESGSIQVYCQRFGLDRTRTGGNQRVNNPNTFPDNHHWLVGQSITASADRLAFAWTDNRQHLGWDIYAKLTDWDLVGCAETGHGVPATLLRPTVSRGRFRLTGTIPGPVVVRDVTGRTVARLEPSGTGAVVDLTGLAAGVYVVTSGRSRARLYQKIVIK